MCDLAKGRRDYAENRESRLAKPNAHDAEGKPPAKTA
jgi:hypothetical protein